MGSVLAMKKVKTQSVKRKKSRKSRRGDKYGDGTCSKINEVNESGDEENNEPLQKLCFIDLMDKILIRFSCLVGASVALVRVLYQVQYAYCTSVPGTWCTRTSESIRNFHVTSS